MPAAAIFVFATSLLYWKKIKAPIWLLAAFWLFLTPVFYAYGGASFPVLAGVAVFLFVLWELSWRDLVSRTVPVHGPLLILAAGLFYVSDIPRAAAGFGIVLLFFLAAAALGRAPLPGGDAKLICACVFFLGLKRGLLGVFFACVPVLIWTGWLKFNGKPVPGTIPFVPYLSAGWYICLFI